MTQPPLPPKLQPQPLLHHLRDMACLANLALAQPRAPPSLAHPDCACRASNNLWDCGGCSSGVKGLHDGIILILDTGFCIGAVVAIILNLLLPVESPMVSSGGARKARIAAGGHAPCRRAQAVV